MKKIGVIVSALVCACLLLGGCTSLRTHKLDDALPDVLDEYSLLPQIESVKITRCADGKQIVLSGTEVDTVMLCFENIVCTRKKSPPPDASYVVEFVMTDSAVVCDPLAIGEVKASRASAFGIGEYYYESIHMKMDVTYLEQLFARSDS